MKMMRRTASLLMALLMIIALATTAFAEVNNSITITSAKTGETYELYKLFDLQVNSAENPTAYSYTVNSDWAAFFAAAEGDNAAGAGRQYVTIDAAGYVTGISDAEALAKAAAEWETKPAAKQSIKAAGTSVVFSNLENGYWLITSTLGTMAMADTTPDKETVEINEKNPENTIEKKVKEDSKKNSENPWDVSNDAQIGDTVEFQSTVTLVKGARNVVIHDTMTDGLTLNAGSIKIDGLTKDTDYTVSESCSDGCTFEIKFTNTYLAGLEAANTTLTLEYSAVLNENAVQTTGEGDNTTTPTTAIVGQTNETYVSFGDATTSQEKTTNTNTHKFEVFKHAKDSNTYLADAVFSLKKNGIEVPLVKINDNNYRVALSSDTEKKNTFTTVADGNIVIWGVDHDSDYTLQEITPPDGYNALTAEISVTFSSGSDTVVDVENSTGGELPSTGGMGTTLFYLFGGIMAAAAVVLLVTKKRMTSAM